MFIRLCSNCVMLSFGFLSLFFLLFVFFLFSCSQFVFILCLLSSWPGSSSSCFFWFLFLFVFSESLFVGLLGAGCVFVACGFVHSLLLLCAFHCILSSSHRSIFIFSSFVPSCYLLSVSSSPSSCSASVMVHVRDTACLL